MTHCLVLNTKFIIFTHFRIDNGSADDCAAQTVVLMDVNRLSAGCVVRTNLASGNAAMSSSGKAERGKSQPEFCKIHHFLNTKLIVFDTKFIVLIHNSSFVMQNSSFLVTKSFRSLTRSTGTPLAALCHAST